MNKKSLEDIGVKLITGVIAALVFIPIIVFGLWTHKHSLEVSCGRHFSWSQAIWFNEKITRCILK